MRPLCIYDAYSKLNKGIKMINQFTYADIKNLERRKEMLDSEVSSIGWQKGGFGCFNEQARVVTTSGANKIKTEVEVNAQLDFDQLMDACPTLKALVG